MSTLSKRSDAITCILNGGAGSEQAKTARDQLTALFSVNGLKAKILLAEPGGGITDMARRAVEGGAGIIVAGGGDGTINGVASALINTGVPLGVLPLGTLNHFAKDLNIPLKLEAAVANLATGHLTRVDVGEVNGRLFLNNSSLGLYPTIVRAREEKQNKGHGKWLAFAEASAYALHRYARLYVGLDAKGRNEPECATPFLFIGNNQYKIAGSRIGERDQLDGGRLWVYRAPRASRVALFRLVLRALRGDEEPAELEIFDAAEFWVRSRKARLHVARDGEVEMFTTPLHYRIVPRALNVIVPFGS